MRGSDDSRLRVFRQQFPKRGLMNDTSHVHVHSARYTIVLQASGPFHVSAES